MQDVSGQGRRRGLPGHRHAASPARSAPRRAPEPRLRSSGIEFAAGERRSSINARKARQTRTSPRGSVYLPKIGKIASARRIKAEFGPIQALAPSSDRPGGAFFASYSRSTPRRYESIVRQTSSDRKPSLGLGAQRKQRPRETRGSKGQASTIAGKSAPAMNGEAAHSQCARARDFALDPPRPWARRLTAAASAARSCSSTHGSLRPQHRPRTYKRPAWSCRTNACPHSDRCATCPSC